MDSPKISPRPFSENFDILQRDTGAEGKKAGGYKLPADDPKVPDLGKSDGSSTPPPVLLPPKKNFNVDDTMLDVMVVTAKIMDAKLQLNINEIKGNVADQTVRNKERIAKMEESRQRMAEANQKGEAMKVLGWIGVGLGAAALYVGAATSVISLILGVALVVTGAGAPAGLLLIGAGAFGLAGTAVGTASWAAGTTLAVMKEIPATNEWMNNTDLGRAFMWTLFAYQMVTGLASAVASLGSAAFSLGAGVVDSAVKSAQILSTVVQLVNGLVSGGMQIAQGCLTVEKSVIEYEASMLQVDARRIDADITKLQLQMEEDQERIKKFIGEREETISKCMDILASTSATKEKIISKMAV
ncbi:type III secretion system translocon subunit SctE [uncultured Thiocystis sp.]|uniref:type III secretion system translocon subunit SctE n=1 Tax=uncultured Thiocystis sp. TaxID=1202134 RepID=UPI0025F19A3F|nr:type III secretion system translocon subunit SctE [uncultured Thiocystis sp.]